VKYDQKEEEELQKRTQILKKRKGAVEVRREEEKARWEWGELVSCKQIWGKEQPGKGKGLEKKGFTQGLMTAVTVRSLKKTQNFYKGERTQGGFQERDGTGEPRRGS